VLSFVETIRGESAKESDERITTPERRQRAGARSEEGAFRERNGPSGPAEPSIERPNDFRDDESDRRTRREGAYAALWFFNARASARAFVCKVRPGFSEARSAATAAWRHQRQICIYQAGATNISFIICSERLICSPRRAASTCPPPPADTLPPVGLPSPQFAPNPAPLPVPFFLLSPSLSSASSRITRHSIPRAGA